MNIPEEIKKLKESLSLLSSTQENSIRYLRKKLASIEKFNSIVDNELYLTVDERDSLRVMFNCGAAKYRLGTIHNNGRCYMLSNDAKKENYSNWVALGMKVKEHNDVEWMGKKYRLTRKGFLLSGEAMEDHIFNFETGRYAINCYDNNIVRYPNNTPKAY